MTTNPKLEAALALHRFGFGPVHNSINAIADDPRGAVLAELERPRAGQVSAANLPSSAEASRAFFEFRAERAAKLKLEQRAKGETNMAATVEPDDALVAETTQQQPTNQLPTANQPPAPNQPTVPVQLIQNEARVRFDAALGADIGFVERLVWFWSNHFCVSIDPILSMAGAYEREAIRPHVLGHFVDMLQAAEGHPAMLYYLDNAESMGPDSVAGINRNRGLNENLAREALELHTLGVRTGYTQTDVTSFANVITGWTFIATSVPNHGGEFAFVNRLHEPGEEVVLGKHYADTGMEQGRAVFADLARHPATARHIGQKLARHFVADEPPPALVDKLAKTFTDSDGNLKEVAKTLVTADESWAPERTKLKPPGEWIMSVLRLTGSQWFVGRVLAAQASLGAPLWRPPAPNGFPDTEAAWIDGIPRRLDVATDFVGRMPSTDEPHALLDIGLGPLASDATRDTIARAESRTQAVALLVMAPEFLRR
jgi:uncharacterized protein (DUF1800 family)